jgi:membrane protein YdbS with pleckstrin-like domain
MEKFSNPEIQIDSLPKHAEVEFHPISKSYLKKSLIQIGILCCAFLAGWVVLAFWVQILFVQIFSLVFILCLFGYWFWNAVKMQKTYGYALREKDILYRRGFIVNKITVIPFNRIQHVSINRDIWDKRLNLSTLNIFTAGGSGSDIRIPGLEPELALRLKDSLAKKVSDDE